MKEAKLWKRVSKYTAQNGEERTAVNFYVECGDVFVPIEVKFFENKETGQDSQYHTRKQLLSAFADILPEKSTTNKNTTDTQSKQTAVQNSNDDDPKIPF
jgi:hypothetical protein